MIFLSGLAEKEKNPLPKQSKGPISKKEPLGGEFIPEHLRPQMDGPRQESLVVRG